MYPDNKNPEIFFPVPSHPHLHSIKESIQNLSIQDHLPQYSRLSNHGKIIAGPLLRYINIDYHRNVYQGSCLIVSTHKYPPKLEMSLKSAATTPSSTSSSKRHHFFRHNNNNTYYLNGEPLDIFRNEYTFWRYEFELPLTNEPQIVTYTSEAFLSIEGLNNNQSLQDYHINYNDKTNYPQFEFHLPSLHQSMRFMFYSCNGFSDIPQEVKDKLGEKEAPLWQDVLDRHDVIPFHVLLGGGDQLYQDRLMKEDFMKPWRDEKDPKKRIAMILPSEMKSGLENFYFWNYVINFGFKDNPVVAKAFATIPSVNMWDDHDIIDGYGSYNSTTQSSDCFQTLFTNSCRFYYLYQQHTTMTLATKHGMIRGTQMSCHHIYTNLGRDIALLSLDARGERTKQDVCQPKSYDIVFEAIYQRTSPSVKHLLVLTGVPIIYPRLTLFEKALESAAEYKIHNLVGKTGALGDIINGQLNQWDGDPELLDDMNDHWTAGNHLVERRRFIERLQTFAKEKSVRVSFLGGDVHACAVGRLYSKDMKNHEMADPFFMVQIVSSAIVNIPPPQALLTILNQNSSYITFSPNVEEKMYNIFKKSPNGNNRQNKKIMGFRNYCAGYLNEESGSINFFIQAELEAGKKGTMGYQVEVPHLIFGPNGKRHLQPSPNLTWNSQSYSNASAPPLPQINDLQQQQQQQPLCPPLNRPVPPPPLPRR